MKPCDDPVALDDWYAIDSAATLDSMARRQILLGHEVTVWRDEFGVARAVAAARDLPVIERYGCIFTSLGRPARALVEIAEAAEADRRVVVCGWVAIRSSAGRIVENFLDMAHFPYVHTDILGAEPHTEVGRYGTDMRDGELWATGCQFWQPRAGATQSEGMMMELSYRVPSPHIVMLYRVSPPAPHRRDAIALFIQPISETLCRAQPVMWLVDPVSTHLAMLQFEQVIFMQDRIILENQRPLRIPLDPAAEVPMPADAASVAYRRWLATLGLRYGTERAA